MAALYGLLLLEGALSRRGTPLCHVAPYGGLAPSTLQLHRHLLRRCPCDMPVVGAQLVEAADCQRRAVEGLRCAMLE